MGYLHLGASLYITHYIFALFVPKDSSICHADIFICHDLITVCGLDGGELPVDPLNKLP